MSDEAPNGNTPPSTASSIPSTPPSPPDPQRNPPAASTQILKLRVQNICCGKESTLLKSTLADVSGIKSVTVNVVARIAYITHDAGVISADDIVDRLNKAHLGASLVESSSPEEESRYNRNEIILYAKVANILVMACLFIAVLVVHFKHYKFERWVATPLLILGSLPMLYKALIDVKRGLIVNINLLMMIAVVGALGLSDWLDACIIVFVFSVADYLEKKAKYQVEKDIGELMMTAPAKAFLVEKNESVPVEDVPAGSIILVTAGESIPLDGEVDKGKASVDESSITGEATPIQKVKGSTVYSGTIVQSGFLQIKTSCTYSSSTMYRVSQLVQEAQSKGSHTEEFINRFTKYYTPFILIVAFLVFMVPFIIYKTTTRISTSELHQWIIRSLTVLLGACPCPLVMAAPIPSVCSIQIATKSGVLIKGAVYLELLAKLDVVVFDKTGTLTEGKFQVVKEHVADTNMRKEAVKLAAALESKSSHPLSAAIVSHHAGCMASKIDELGLAVGLPEVTEFKNHDGMGLSGNIEGHVVCVGNVKLMDKFSVPVDVYICEKIQEWSLEGYTVIVVGIDGKLQLLLGLADKCRPSSRALVKALQDSGLDCVMLTGDSEGAASAIKCQVGLSKYCAGMKPSEKLEWVIEAQVGGKKKQVVAMIGDGVNDSPGLAAADVGIAIGPSGSSIAVEAAGIALMTLDLTKIADIILLGKFCQKLIWQNLIGAIGIKLSFVIVALIGRNLLWLAVLSDVLGLVFVICNGLRPLKWKSNANYDMDDVFTDTTDDDSPEDSRLDVDTYADLSRMRAASLQSSGNVFNIFSRLRNKTRTSLLYADTKGGRI